MPGTLVRDSLAINVLAGATLNAAGATNGTVAEAAWPGDVSFVLATGTVTGTSPTIDVLIQGADNAAFNSGVVTLGQIEASGGSQSNTTRQITTSVHKRYVRATVTVAGTTPVYTGSTCFIRTKDDRRTNTTSA